MRKNFYLLVEEGFRELPSRLLIAAAIAGYDRDVWIGQQWWFAENFARLPPGVVLFKGNNGIQAHNMRRAKTAGHVVASMEEEAFGLSTFDGEKLYNRHSGKYCDLFCVQGESLAEFVRCRLPNTQDKVVVTGNPRADLLTAPQDSEIRRQASFIKAEYGSFILINTNYASINPFDIDVYNYYQRCVDVAVYDDRDPEDHAKFDRLIGWEHQNLRLIVDFIRRWPKGGSMPIVVRPHPSESTKFWHDIMEPLDHVSVIEDTDHLAWTAASEWMVHTSSTTGLEAFLLGVPSISLCPPNSPFSGHFLSNTVNTSFNDVGKALRHVWERVLQPQNLNGDTSAFFLALNEHLATGNVKTAATRVANALMEVHPALTRYSATRPSQQPFVKISNTNRQIEKVRIDLAAIRAKLLGLEVTEIAPMVFRIAMGAERYG